MAKARSHSFSGVKASSLSDIIFYAEVHDLAVEGSQTPPNERSIAKPNASLTPEPTPKASLIPQPTASLSSQPRLRQTPSPTVAHITPARTTDRPTWMPVPGPFTSHPNQMPTINPITRTMTATNVIPSRRAREAPAAQPTKRPRMIPLQSQHPVRRCDQPQRQHRCQCRGRPRHLQEPLQSLPGRCGCTTNERTVRS